MPAVEAFVLWSLGIAFAILFWVSCLFVGILISQWVRYKIKEIKKNTEGESK